ncbi:hypothetical protein [Streptodolium elevatio]|uniref:Tail terminator n=1 Tax=Streptodolium elevatio TaxID=3157996 RepID=A0ABV3DLE9_9ACTN
MRTRAPVDAESVVIAALKSVLALGPTGRVAARTPDNLESYARFVQVQRAGGPSDRFASYPVMYVASFAPSYDAAAALAVDVDDAFMHALPGTVIAGGRIQDVEGRSGPSPLDYENPLVVRFQAVYSLAVCPVG